MENENYRKRLIDEKVEKYLKTFGAVCIEGPKWCGKTWTSRYHSNSEFLVGAPDNNFQNRKIAQLDVNTILIGENPRLIDEWQIAPKLWDAVRFEVDHRSNEGQFILTGSAVPVNMDKITHTGTGRFAWLTLRPMTLYESNESNGSVSLNDLFDGSKKINGVNNLDIEDIAYLCCRGGWPRSLYMEKDIALDQAFDYYDAVINSDISRVDNVNRNPERVKNIMRSYARNIGSQASYETIKNDIINNDSFCNAFLGRPGFFMPQIIQEAN